MSSQLTLLIPGLLWPRPALDDTVSGLHLPALQDLLGRASSKRMEGIEVADWLCQNFSLKTSTLPAAALRLVGQGDDPEDAEWICADPVHLSLSAQGASIGDPCELALTAAEDAALRETLAPLLSRFGVLSAAAPGCWHLRLTAPAPAFPAQLHPGTAQALLPAGEAARTWRQLINEAQMALHAHPVNQARQSAGQSVVNSLVFWGAGCLPRQAHAAFEYLLSDDVVHRGLAHLAGIKAGALPAAFAPAPGHSLAVLDLLAAPTRLHDALAWREALETLERNWVAPALNALTHGRLRNLCLLAFGERGLLELRATANSRWRFWCRPRPLTDLAAPPFTAE